jgi:hypothetical protein
MFSVILLGDVLACVDQPGTCEAGHKRRRLLQLLLSRFNVSCPWQEAAVSTASFSLLFLVPSFSDVQFEYSFVYVSLHSA